MAQLGHVQTWMASGPPETIKRLRETLAATYLPATSQSFNVSVERSVLYDGALAWLMSREATSEKHPTPEKQPSCEHLSDAACLLCNT